MCNPNLSVAFWLYPHNYFEHARGVVDENTDPIMVVLQPLKPALTRYFSSLLFHKEVWDLIVVFISQRSTTSSLIDL